MILGFALSDERSVLSCFSHRSHSERLSIGRAFLVVNIKTQPLQSKTPAENSNARCLFGGYDEEIEKEEKQHVTKMTAQSMEVAYFNEVKRN